MHPQQAVAPTVEDNAKAGRIGADMQHQAFSRGQPHAGRITIDHRASTRLKQQE
jgi:hypothetical protein